jgi:hypothetical protein
MTSGNTMIVSAAEPDVLVWVTTRSATAVLLCLLAVAAGWMSWQRKRGNGRRRTETAALRVAAVAAVGCTAYSADTSWRFAADYLDMSGTIERAAMFAVAELALFATALMARANLNGPKQAPGLPGTLTWVITAVQILPAYAESGPIGGTVRAFVGPIMAALLWHLAMGIELRHRSPHASSHSLAAVLARHARERLLARLQIADRNADATRIIRERALDQAVALILRAEAIPPAKRTKRSARRVTRRLHRALEQADVDRDERQDELLLRKLATRQQALALASIALPARWPSRATGASGDVSPALPRLAETARAEKPGRPPAIDEGDEDADRTARPEPDDRPPPPARTTPGEEPYPGKEAAGSDPGETGQVQAMRTGRKPRATRNVLVTYARRLHHETGRLSRDLLENTVRSDGYSVASDTAGEVVRTIKAELNDARASDGKWNMKVLSARMLSRKARP